MRVLKAAEGAPFNILHVCKSNNLMKHMLDYPVAAFNWDAHDPTNLSIKEARKLIKGKALLAGVRNDESLLNISPDDAANEALDIRKQASDSQFGLASGCTVPTRTPSATLKAIRNVYEG
jgi:uroporphyrinogen decarboxylase